MIEEETLLQDTIHEGAKLLAERFREKLTSIEVIIKTQKDKIADLEQKLITKEGLHQAALMERNSEYSLLQERYAELIPRPVAHQHDPDEPRPVLVFDLDGTLKPQIETADGGNYPVSGIEEPFPKVKKWLDLWRSRGACLHVATAGLYYGHRDDLEIYDARLKMMESWNTRHGLGIEIFLPKVPSDLYFDDRMIEVPKNDSKRPPPDWDLIGELAEEQMAKRFDLKNGVWTRKPKNRIGSEIEEFPDITEFKSDHPRGLSGPRIDVDMHRTISLASSSLREAPPRPGAAEGMQALYDRGITIRVSCAGWNPKTHPKEDAYQRLAAIRRWLLEYKIPYDRIVTKDHGDLYFDDKGMTFTGWENDLPVIMKRLPEKEMYKQGD